MDRVLSAVAVTLVSAFVIAFALIFLGATTQHAVCHGTVPQWTLDAQNYQGGGCPLIIPRDQAPADADWTPIHMWPFPCHDGELNIDDVCIAVPADQPWDYEGQISDPPRPPALLTP
jgi:hypothetical protein